MRCNAFPGYSVDVHTVQKSHYPPGNHQVSTSKNVLFPGQSHLLTTGADDPSLELSPSLAIIKVKGQQYRLLAGGYDLAIEHF